MYDVAIQAVEWHIVYGLEHIFSPGVIELWDEDEISAIASELSPGVVRQREFSAGRKKMLKRRTDCLQDDLETHSAQRSLSRLL